jgi:hypothetical protein
MEQRGVPVRRLSEPWRRGPVDPITEFKNEEELMVNPGVPTNDPVPCGNIPSEVPPGSIPDEEPDIGPTGPRTPYPVNDPGIMDPKGPGSEPDYLPGNPTDPGTRL